MAEEMIDVLDENGIKTGAIATRKKVHKISISKLNELRESGELVPRDEVYDVLTDYLFRF